VEERGMETTVAACIFSAQPETAVGVVRVLASLKQLRTECRICSTIEDVVERCKTEQVDAVFCAEDSAGPLAPDTIRALKERCCPAPVILLAKDAGEERMLTALRAGADDCLPVNALTSENLTRALWQTVARKETQSQLGWCEEMVSAVFQNWEDMVLLVDADTGRILKTNRATSRILGYKPEELVGRNFATLFPRLSMKDKEIWHERIRASDSVFEYQEFVHADGSNCPLDVMAVLLDIHGRKVIVANLRDASERFRVEEALRRSEKRYQQLTESLTDYIYRVRVERNCPVETHHSEACVGVTGYAPEDFNTDPYLWINMVHEEDRDIVRRQAEGILARRDVASVVHRIVKKNGEVRWVSNIPVPCYDGDGNLLSYDGLVKDITERVIADKEQKQLVAVIEQTDQGVMITDARGVIQYVNSAFEQISGYPREEVIGKKPSMFSSGYHTTEFFRDMWNTISHGNTWSGQIICRRKNGSIQHIQTTVSPMRDEKGQITNYVSVRRDITQDLLMQERLRQAQKMEAIGTLAGGIAHDFNNILAAVLGFAELLQDEIPEEGPATKHLSQVIDAANRAKELVQQILSFSRKVGKEFKPLQVHNVIEEALKLLRASLPTTIEIVEDIDLESGQVLGDATQVHQIVMNLCTNAYHAMREKGGILTISLHRVELKGEIRENPGNLPRGAYVRLSVRDTGHGMSKETQERIFMPFFTTKPTGEGTGLGLAIVQGIVTGFGGAITVESEMDKGSCFDVYLPTLTTRSADEASGGKAMAKGRGERILFVDDEAMLASLWLRRLSSLGYEVVVKSDASEALDEFAAAPSRFDLVITDQTMPHMTGLDLATRILRIRPGMPIILTTGYSDLVTPEMVKEKGVREYVQKPVMAADFSQIIRKILDSPRSKGKSLPRLDSASPAT
jgi:PAS domain S-box-containing protein